MGTFRFRTLKAEVPTRRVVVIRPLRGKLKLSTSGRTVPHVLKTKTDRCDQLGSCHFWRMRASLWRTASNERFVRRHAILKFSIPMQINDVTKRSTVFSLLATGRGNSNARALDRRRNIVRGRKKPRWKSKSFGLSRGCVLDPSSPLALKGPSGIYIEIAGKRRLSQTLQKRWERNYLLWPGKRERNERNETRAEAGVRRDVKRTRGGWTNIVTHAGKNEHGGGEGR